MDRKYKKPGASLLGCSPSHRLTQRSIHYSQNGWPKVRLRAFHRRSRHYRRISRPLTDLLQVGNANAYGQGDWVDDMRLAQTAGIDAFALNIGATDPTTTAQVPLAYTAAAQTGFKVFLSFDYAAQGPFASQTVINTIRKYANSPGQFKVNNLPLVSTFEGRNNASDWATIRQSTPLFFVPEWTSISPNDFKSTYEHDADGVCT